jgi:AcrR family transcriptional regulator
VLEVATGLRERRKQETRQAISDIATRMFVERGFDEVTIAQVADAAGVAKMTVTNYFPRKEDLVFDRAEATIASLAEAVARRSPREGLLAAISRDYEERITAGDVTLGPPTTVFARLVLGSHVLASRAREIEDLREQALGDAIAAEAGTDGPQQRAVAAHLSSVHRVLFAEATRRALAGEPAEEIRLALAVARPSAS